MRSPLLDNWKEYIASLFEVASMILFCWYCNMCGIRDNEVRHTPVVHGTLSHVTFTHPIRHEAWPLCPRLEDDDPSSDPTIDGCGFFMSSSQPQTFRMPTEREYQAFWKRVHSASYLDGTQHWSCRRLNQRQQDRFEQARALVEWSAPPEGAWQWAEVVRVVHDLGDRIPLCLGEASENEDRAAFFNPLPGIVTITRKGIVAGIGELAESLIHEATHIVYFEHWAVLSGVGIEEGARAMSRCGDFREIERQATEALAYVNGFLWSAEHRPPPDRNEWDMWRLAQEARRGDMHARVSFAVLIKNRWLLSMGSMEELRFLVSASEEDVAQLHQEIDLACGPLVRRDGNRYAYAFPSDVEPEFLEDMVEFSELDLDDRCRLDSQYLEYTFPCFLLDPLEDTASFNRFLGL